MVVRTIFVGPNTPPTLATQIPGDSVSGSNPSSYVVDLLDVLGGGEDAFADAEEGTALTYTVTENIVSGTAVISVDISGTTLTVDYRNGGGNAGSSDITVTATDSWGETATNTFTVTRT